MKIKIAKNAKEDSENLGQIINLCNSFVDSKAYNDGDIRIVVFTNIRSLAHASLLISNLLDSWSRGDEQVRQIIPQLLGITQVNQKSVDYAGQVLSKNSKLNLAVLSNFQVENFITHLSKYLNLKKHSAFYDKLDELLKHLNLHKYREDFLILAHIRNSLHTNGIHLGYKDQSSNYIKNGIPYDFNHNQIVECASLSHIVLVLGSILDTINKILQCDEVKKIKEIKDAYFVQKVEKK